MQALQSYQGIIKEPQTVSGAVYGALMMSKTDLQ
jgi:hypothetical protein